MNRGLLILAAALVLAAPAQATVIEVADGVPAYPYQRWADRAKVPTPTVTLTVIEQPCGPGYGGMVVDGYAAACTIDGALAIQLAPTLSPAQARGAFLHELGHNFDYYSLTPADREDFLGLVGGTTWRDPGARAQSPHELFAEVYRTCATGGWRRWRTTDGDVPFLPLGAMTSACYLIRR